MINWFNVDMIGFERKIIDDILTLINRGGAVSMTTITVLVFCSMGFAGVMSTSGMLDVVLDAILIRVKTTFGNIINNSFIFYSCLCNMKFIHLNFNSWRII
ncbi:Na+/H+ antiporter NhaC family protein [Anaerococcus hydrogenalis]|uniref:Na+/H+ antiporter NhaC family protein n=1 Tax=Anaerococcus hydrogenalis TaxID=33029 RepID=UPI002903FEDD|nr:Na+/H+ antiporter NhaC family protein [Anaerococcus hydrogenalis]MDU1316755.1 Na+/H+ antiporter NhaC family protein [Anaerococcus hydrogenalis]